MTQMQVKHVYRAGISCLFIQKTSDLMDRYRNAKWTCQRKKKWIFFSEVFVILQSKRKKTKNYILLLINIIHIFQIVTANLFLCRVWKKKKKSQDRRGRTLLRGGNLNDVEEMVRRYAIKGEKKNWGMMIRIDFFFFNAVFTSCSIVYLFS